jgi:hypothetical protein
MDATVRLPISTKSSGRPTEHRNSKYFTKWISSITRLNETCSSQDLALEARDIWLEWNRSIKESCVSDLPHPLTPEDELLSLCGVYHLADGPNMIERYVENLRVMEDTAPTFRDLQFIKVRGRLTSGNFLLTVRIGQQR